MKSVVALASIK